MAKHEHAEFMIQAALDSSIEWEVLTRFDENDQRWVEVDYPGWYPGQQYRVKFQPAPNQVIDDLFDEVVLKMQADPTCKGIANREFAHIFDRAIVKKCADAADMGCEATKYVGDYVTEALGYENSSL